MDIHRAQMTIRTANNSGGRHNNSPGALGQEERNKFGFSICADPRGHQHLNENMSLQSKGMGGWERAAEEGLVAGSVGGGVIRRM